MALMTAANKIRIYRALHGLGQIEFGHYMGADRPAVAKWEKGIYLPRPEEMQQLNIYNWIRVETLLPPQIFIPLLPHLAIRPQQINHMSRTIFELLGEFCTSEGISAATIMSVQDGDIIQLGDHIIIALGSMRQISTSLPPSVQITKLPPTKDLLSDAISEKQTCMGLINKAFGIPADTLETYNYFRIEDLLWNGLARLEFALTATGVQPDDYALITKAVEEAVKEAVVKKIQEAKGIAPSVSVEFKRLV